MKEYKDKTAYETIECETINNFFSYINVDVLDSLNVVIVGACHGVEIQELLDLYTNINICAFEPIPSSFKVLTQTYNKYPNVKCYKLAISDEKKSCIFYEVSEPGNGSLKKFISDGYNEISEELKIHCVPLKDIFKEEIDLLWIDTQGNELEVLKGVEDLNLVKSLFLEVTMDIDSKIAYEDNCLFTELEDYLKPTHYCHSIGLDNENNNGTGNSFWLRNNFKI